MKRVIDGVTYNTDTATKVATWEYEDDNHYDTVATLYQTRGGAFFAVHVWEVPDSNDIPRSKVYFEAMSRDELQRMVERGDNLTILNSGILEEPPEAEAEEAPGATLYIRVPTSLKDKIEAAAGDEKLSINAWAMRCMESCLASRQSS